MQPPLPLRGESRPLVLATVSEARALLPGFDEDGVKLLWEDSHLIGWNIGLGYTTEARLWRDSIVHFATTAGKPPFPRPHDHVVEDLLRSNKPFLTTTQVKLMLNCGADHVLNLITEKQLSVVPGTSYHAGASGVALITLSSLRNFFSTRKLK